MNKKKSNSPIGVFDSGVGGLTVVFEIMHHFPNEHIVYFGDTAHVPYGNKSEENIINFSRQIIKFLITQNVKAIIIACNTASAYALKTINNEFNIPIIGVIEPAAIAATLATQTHRIGVIGTKGTILSKEYDKIIHNIDNKSIIFSKACPLLVPLVEEGLLNDYITIEVTRRYLKPLLKHNIDTLIMGCTHYPIIKSIFLKLINNNNITLINPAHETIIKLKKLFDNNIIINNTTISNNKEYNHFYVSDDPEKFKNLANLILHYNIKSIKKIKLENY